MNVRSALVMAGLMLAFTVIVVVADKAGFIGDETSQRAVQVAIGLVVVYCANLAPKTLESMTSRCDPAKVQSLQRFSGWSLVIGGLGYAMTWLVAPIEYAGVTSMAVLGASLLLVLARYAWTLKSRADNQPSA